MTNIIYGFKKDSNQYQYSYISLRMTGGCIRSLIPIGSRHIYQLIDEDSGYSLYNSEPFTGTLSHKGVHEFNKLQNYMTQNDWQSDGKVYCPTFREYLPRYRKSRSS